MTRSLDRVRLRWLTNTLLSAYGRQHWWPGETRFEVMAGAILTQNTAWKNVQRALLNLKSAGVLSPTKMAALSPAQLADLIHPAGYFNIKAQRLGNLCRFVLQQGGVAALSAWPSELLRRSLLEIKGIGPETADSILLYAFDRPVFVIDAYTRRILRRLDMIQGDEPYEVLRALLERGLDADSGLYNELHALIVEHAKSHCSSKPRCSGCCLVSRCAGAVEQNTAIPSDAKGAPNVRASD